MDSSDQEAIMTCNEKVLHLEDAVIDRGDGSEAVARLRDEEGKVIFEFGFHWTDSQIKHALRFANDQYARGIRVGRERKAQEIRSALGIGG
jgi:hypothetical protein